MIEVKPVNQDPQEYEDVNSDIHKEYNLLVFKYAELLKCYMELSKQHKDLVDHDKAVTRELNDLKERYLNDKTKYSAMP